MRKPARRLFTLCSALSLLLCLTAAALWVAGQWRRTSTGEDALRSDYFDKTYEVSAGDELIVVRWSEIIDLASGERKAFDTRYTSPGDRTFVFARAPDGTGPFGNPWARHGVLAFPHWAAVLATGTLPALWLLTLVRRQRRRRDRGARGLCLRCGYDLRASPERCPECGVERIPSGAG